MQSNARCAAFGLRTYAGFTLIELSIVLVVLGILLALSVPAFNQTRQRNESTTIAQDLTKSFQLARQEAMTRGTTVSVCASQDTSYTQCGSDWTQGWIVFTNPDDNSSIANTETVLRTHAALSQGIQFSAAQNIVSFDANGYLTATQSYTITPQTCVGTQVIQINLNQAGHISQNTTNCP